MMSKRSSTVLPIILPALALLTTGNAVYAQSLSTKIDYLGMPGIPDYFNELSDLPATVALSDSYSAEIFAPGIRGVSAAVEADFGIVRSRSSLIGEDLPFGTQADLLTTVATQDSFTISSPGLAGTMGTVSASVLVEGSGYAIQPPEADAALLLQAYSGGTVAVTLQAGFDPPGDAQVNTEWRSFPNGYFMGDTLPAVATVTIPFEFGAPIAFSIHIGTGIEIANQTITVGTISTGLDLYDTAAWLGFEEVLDGEGQPVTEFTVESASGFDYSQPHPSTLPAPRFGDVPFEYWAYSFVEALAASGITSGCGGGNYCPEAEVSRAQMAVFLERGMKGSSYSPPAASGNLFMDVGPSAFAASFIEQLYLDGITAGCGNNNYCPASSVSRAQMAVFLLRAKYGAGYSPPAASGVFNDVGTGYWAAAWIEQLADEGITAGCGNSLYCPEHPVTRAQMAVFLVRTFGL